MVDTASPVGPTSKARKVGFERLWCRATDEGGAVGGAPLRSMVALISGIDITDLLRFDNFRFA
jgi:hypothetical protein